MCSKIAMKNEINEDMEKTLAHQPLHQLKGTDYEEGGRQATYYESQEIDNEKGVMPKTMNIHIGAKVSITQNLDQEAGIVNGTKGYVKAVHNNAIKLKKNTPKH